MTGRRNAPVFIVGSPRSGTTWLYHMVLSAGDFAVYHSESHVFNMLVPRFNGLRRRADREEMLREWLPSEYFRRTGLTENDIRDRVLNECRNGGDFLRLVMGTIAAKQGVRRWAETTPTNLMHVEEIKSTIPEALFIHIIRDGRDVALSMAQQGWVRLLPGSRCGDVLAAGFFWEWLVDLGRRNLKRFPDDAIEIRYEDLVTEPQKVLTRVGAFIEHDLDYDRILASGIGSVKAPNTSFRGAQDGGFNPVGRWKNSNPEELARLESAIGKLLDELGYARATPLNLRRKEAWISLERFLYRARFAIRSWLKLRTPLGRRFTSIGLLRDYRAGDMVRLRPKKTT